MMINNSYNIDSMFQTNFPDTSLMLLLKKMYIFTRSALQAISLLRLSCICFVESEGMLLKASFSHFSQ